MGRVVGTGYWLLVTGYWLLFLHNGAERSLTVLKDKTGTRCQITIRCQPDAGSADRCPHHGCSP
jgi:hypothetical protein